MFRNVDWVNQYLQDKSSIIGVYIALLGLRFERRNNYEKIIDLEELYQQYKTTLSILLNPNEVNKAYLTGLEFLYKIFENCPECLQAKPRFHYLELIESKFYNKFRNAYLEISIPKINKIPEYYRTYIARIFEHIKYGRIYNVDRTCVGSVYISRFDFHDPELTNLQSFNIDILIPYLYEIGVIKASDVRCIIPAPLLEYEFIDKLRGIEFYVIKSQNIDKEIERFMNYLGYITSINHVVKTEFGEEFVIDIYAFKKLPDFIFRIWIFTKYIQQILTKQIIDKIYEIYVNSIEKPNLIIIICKKIDQKLLKEVENYGFIIIETENVLHDFKTLIKYINLKLMKILLSISNISEVLFSTKDLFKRIEEILIKTLM